MTLSFSTGQDVNIKMLMLYRDNHGPSSGSRGGATRQPSEDGWYFNWGDVGIAPHREEEKDDRSRKQEEGTDQGTKDTVI